MKQYLLSVVLLFLPFICFAQEEEHHLSIITLSNGKSYVIDVDNFQEMLMTELLDVESIKPSVIHDTLFVTVHDTIYSTVHDTIYCEQKPPVISEVDGHEYVDFGLPSGTLWAKVNVGASSSTEAGDFFAWGEITPKSTFSQSNYIYYDVTKSVYTKYADDWAYSETLDNLNTLCLEDDPAYNNWGGEWRIPTPEQWDELLTNCIWTSISGGYRVSSNITNQSMILPLVSEYSYSGYPYSYSQYYTHYMSNELKTMLTAKYFLLYSGTKYAPATDNGISTRSRYESFTVRPVRNKR